MSWPYSFIQSGLRESPQALDMFSFSSIILECELRWRSQPAQGFRSISPFYPVATAPPFIRYREECSWNKPCPLPSCNLRKPLTVGRLKPEMSKQAWGVLLISEPPCTYFTPSSFPHFLFFSFTFIMLLGTLFILNYEYFIFFYKRGLAGLG